MKNNCYFGLVFLNNIVFSYNFIKVILFFYLFLLGGLVVIELKNVGGGRNFYSFLYFGG